MHQWGTTLDRRLVPVAVGRLRPSRGLEGAGCCAAGPVGCAHNTEDEQKVPLETSGDHGAQI